MDHPAKYTIGDILKAVDVERERFKEWTMKGFIESSEKVRQGKRILHLYSQLDAYCIGLFKHLIEKAGLSRASSAAFCRTWKKEAKELPLNLPGIMWNFLVFYRRGDEFFWHQLVNLHPHLADDEEEWWDRELERALLGTEIQEAIKKYPDFDNIIVVNFAKIRDGINERLKKLE
ncbi:hypothetical protein LCGC14_2489880 [marine sediment metagenome]|uniref:HTH merR-type domain-containing protein n=1 Tax=marine sediment metagenome TaxID=412755 RepID=A0A0F9DGV3_9ZZZZ|nr:hypothetical protein [Desulfobacterales bacterium]